MRHCLQTGFKVTVRLRHVAAIPVAISTVHPVDLSGPDLVVAGPLPAGVQVTEAVDDVHAAVRTAERRLGAWMPAGREQRHDLSPQPVVRPQDDLHQRLPRPKLIEGLIKLPAGKGRLACGLAVTRMDGGRVCEEVT